MICRKPKDWIMVRVQRTTHERLMAEKRRIEKSREKGHNQQLALHESHGLPLDTVISLLLNDRESHVRRSNRSNRKVKREGNDQNGTDSNQTTTETAE